MRRQKTKDTVYQEDIEQKFCERQFDGNSLVLHKSQVTEPLWQMICSNLNVTFIAQILKQPPNKMVWL